MSDWAKPRRGRSLQKTEPINRDKHEISGYRYVLDMIHESHDDISVTPSVILQRHCDLCRFQDVGLGGRWKDADNYIAERTDVGAMVV